jgi:hypothetical protein
MPAMPERTPMPYPIRTLTFTDKIVLGWGKLRRAYLITCRPDFVRRNLTRRVGACARTGACCQLMFECQALDRSNPCAACTIYLHRGPNCSIFPIDERDLRDRDRIMPERPCGYRFIPKGEFARTNGRRTAAHPFPWEIDGSALGGKVRRTTAFTMALAYLKTFWTVGKGVCRNGNGRGKEGMSSLV